MQIDNLSATLRTHLQSAAVQTNALMPQDTGTPVSELTTPAAIYHEGQRVFDTPPPNASGAIVYARLQNTMEEDLNYDKILTLLTHGLADASAELRYATDAAMAQVPPELAAKDWGFSLRNNQLTFSKGEDPLSKDEVATLRAAFESTGVAYAARAVADAVITAIRYEREWGADDVAMGIGRFDVSQKNFGDIVDLRDYLDEFAPGSERARHLINPLNYRALYFSGGHVMIDMIVARAEPRFAGRESDSVEWNTTRVMK